MLRGQKKTGVLVENAAASVLQQTWFIHKHKTGKGGRDDFRVRIHQRKFLQAINELPCPCPWPFLVQRQR